MAKGKTIDLREFFDDVIPFEFMSELEQRFDMDDCQLYLSGKRTDEQIADEILTILRPHLIKALGGMNAKTKQEEN